ncbi:MAG: SOS response-associated peptidase [Gemmatimonadaceae bacterium]
MCGRSSLHDAPVGVLARFELPPHLPGFEPRYNIAPTQQQWAIALGRERRPMLASFRWGLIPSWASDPALGARMINARSDSLASKPAWRDLVERRRCLVIADGYYEWNGTGKSRAPYFFHLAGHGAFAMAALWDRWSGGEETVETCTIITVEATRLAATIHHRMPAIFSPDASERWLHSATSTTQALALLAPYEKADLECYEVSRLVNTPANDSPECIVPAA